MRTRLIRAIFDFGLCGILVAVAFVFGGLSPTIAIAETSAENYVTAMPVISKLRPDGANGRGYKLVYYVDAPIEISWKFKTDFDNQLLLSNRYINSHRLVISDQSGAVTETEYSNKAGTVFRWQSTVFPERYLLKYVLMNPDECGQKYHYGSIQLEAMGSGTRVTQLAYFDFFGVSLWMSYPFAGGMSHFLNYTAGWEQQAILDYSSSNEE
jgi:hypothetical protein